MLSKGRSAEIYLVLLVFFILASASKKFRQCSLRGKCECVISAIDKSNEGGREMSNQVGKAGLLILAQNLFFGLVWGSNYEMDMLRLKFTLRGK